MALCRVWALSLLLLVSEAAKVPSTAPPTDQRRPEILPQDCGRQVLGSSGPAQPVDQFAPEVRNTSAYHGQFPWQAHLLTSDQQTNTNVHLCSGVIIGRRHVLTAAHCVRDVAASDLRVRVGDFRRDQIEESEQDSAVVSFHKHPEYREGQPPGRPVNDLALLLLKDDLRFDNYSQPACIAMPGVGFDELRYAPCAVSGWTTSNDTGTISHTEALQYVQVPLVSDSYCVSPEIYGRNNFQPDRMMCAGHVGVDAETDSCNRDSGGPLMCQNLETDPFEVYGIVAGGDDGDCMDKPGVYTEVAFYVSWITEHMQADLSAGNPGDGQTTTTTTTTTTEKPTPFTSSKGDGLVPEAPGDAAITASPEEQVISPCDQQLAACRRADQRFVRFIDCPWLCDGHQDCLRGSDEGRQFCRSYTCPDGWLKCYDGLHCVWHERCPPWFRP